MIARALMVSRSNLRERLAIITKRTKIYTKMDDEKLLPYILEITDKRSSYGYRRVTTLLNQRLQQEHRVKVNHKRVY